jgi:RNA polymerase sigma factor (sigma-70 family)
MQIKSDSELLNEYAAHNSEAAFDEIVRRYADFVYSAALRQTGNTESARDVAQTVFIILARKAGSLPANSVLIGWLCHSARLAALEQLRKDQRRQQRERQAMDLVEATPETTTDDWNTVRPVLDEAIASLGGEDRDALLLRFFKNESLAAVGTALGVSEDAAQKRVSRALGKLREFLTGRGINTTATALSATLVANAIRAAPAGISGSLAAVALTKAAASPFYKLFTFANMKTSIPLLTLAGGLIVLSALQINSRKQLTDARALANEQAETINALRAAGPPPADPAPELAQLRADAKDVLRLRAEVTRLQRDLATSHAPVLKPVEIRRPETPPEPQINIKAKFISVPATFASIDGSLLTVPQIKTLMESLEKTAGADIVSQSDVTTLSGHQAQIQVTLDGRDTNNPPQLTVDVFPVAKTNSAEIKLDFAITSDAMVDLPPEDRPPDGSSRVRSVHAFTNSISLWDGQTLVLGRSISNDEKWLAALPGADIMEPRNLLILLTTTLISPTGDRLFPEKEHSQTAQSAD